MTIFLILANLFVFYREIASPDINTFLLHYALVPNLVRLGNLTSSYSLVSAMFVHAGLVHIISNMLFLWVFGRNVEARLGWLYMPIYIIGGLVGNLVQYLASPHSIIPIVGASGAIATVLGIYLVYYSKHQIKTLLFVFIFITLIQVPAWLMLLYWFAVQYLSVYFSLFYNMNNSGIAYLAHIAGFAVGLATALIIGYWDIRFPSTLEHRENRR